MRIPENLFIVINIIIVLMYIWFIIRSYRKGFLYELCGFLGFVAAFFVSWFIAPILADHFPIFTMKVMESLSEQIAVVLFTPLANTLVWFVIILVLLKIIMALILPIFKGVSKIPLVGTVNKILGAIFGIVNATIWVLIFSLVLSLPFVENGADVKEGTFIKHVTDLSDKTIIYLTEHIDIKGMENVLGDDISDVNALREEFVVWLKDNGIINE